MKLIRQAVTAFAVWAVLLFAWASVSHFTGLAGPARMTSASLGLAADALDALDPPAPLAAAPRLAAAQVRGAAAAAEGAHGAIEASAGALFDRLGHARAHDEADRREMRWTTIQARRVASRALRSSSPASIRVSATRRGLTPLEIEREVARERRERVWMNRTQTLDSGEDVRLHVGLGDEAIWMDATSDPGAATPDFSLKLDAGVDRDKVKKWLERLLDLLEDLEASNAVSPDGSPAP